MANPDSRASTNPAQTHSATKPNGIESKRRDDCQKYNRERIRSDLKKRELQSTKSTVLEDVIDIKARLHRITLSTDKSKAEAHTFSAIKGFLGEFWPNPNYKPEDRGGKYGVMLIKQLPNFQINVLSDPSEGYLPLMQIEVHPRGDISLETHKRFLLQLAKAIPGLGTSKVEYAIDVFCPSFFVPALFWLLWRSLLIPYQRTIKFYPDGFAKTGKRTNCSIIWGSADAPDRLYERGEDEDEKGDGWEIDDVDRVRLEHTANRAELTNHGIVTLEDLIQDPKFQEINEGIWKFKRFKQSKRSKEVFPQEWDDYPAEDDAGYPGSFQAQYNAFGKPRRSVEDVPEQRELRDSLIKAMKVFENEWRTLPL